MLFAIQVQNTGHIFLLLVCIVALGHKKTCFSSPPVPKNRAAPVFHFIFILRFSYKKTAPKHFRARAVTMRVSSRCTRHPIADFHFEQQTLKSIMHAEYFKVNSLNCDTQRRLFT